MSITWIRTLAVPSSTSRPALTVIEPPLPSMAWRALISRFSSTCSSCTGSPSTDQPRLHLHPQGDAVLLRVAGQHQQHFVHQPLHSTVAERRLARGPGPSIDVQIWPALVELWNALLSAFLISSMSGLSLSAL